MGSSKNKEALCFQDFRKRSVRVVTRLREIEKVLNRTSKQLVRETRDSHHKTAMSDYFIDEEALTACIVNFLRHFQSSHLKEEAILRSASWQ